MVLEQPDIYMEKINLYNSLITFIKNKLKIDHKINVKWKTIIVLWDTIEKNLCDLGFSNKFSDYYHKHDPWSKKLVGLLKIKKLCSIKDTLK